MATVSLIAAQYEEVGQIQIYQTKYQFICKNQVKT